MRFSMTESARAALAAPGDSSSLDAAGLAAKAKAGTRASPLYDRIDRTRATTI